MAFFPSLICAISLALLFVFSPLLPADEVSPAGLSVSETVDQHIQQVLEEAGVTPAGQADDANLIRRLTLDLAGRIPTVAEVQSYLESDDSQKRSQLIDRLMSSGDFVRHQVDELDTMLMSATSGNLRPYLMKAVSENRSWDQIFREVLEGDETSEQQKGASEFLLKRIQDVDKLANSVSVCFFGVNISCAKCHDHPLVPDWTQDHFYGMKSFFNRTFENGGFLAEREYGTVQYKTTDGESRQAKLMFLSGLEIKEPDSLDPTDEEKKKEKARLEEYKKKKLPLPKPAFSRRSQLIEIALEPKQQDFFSRSIVNRLWHRFFGYGLVMPLDQMHSENPSSHPELLSRLANDLVDHGYDLRRLIRGFVLSETYSRLSRWENGPRPADDLFAVAQVRPLTPMQYAVSLKLASSNMAHLSQDAGSEPFEAQMEKVHKNSRSFANFIEQPRTNFQISVAEALLLSNGQRVQQELLQAGNDRLISQLEKTKDPKELIDLAIWTILCRTPQPEEYQWLGEYLANRPDRRLQACQQIVWSLLASTEFRFNY